jgi:formylglycine-generating enzyme required for sulfatase activity
LDYLFAIVVGLFAVDVVHFLGAAQMPNPGDLFTLNLAGKAQFKFVRVPAGEFFMGSTDQDHHARAEEKPQRLVYLPEFWISKFTITDADYLAYSKDMHIPRPAHWESQKNNTSRLRTPVVYVSAGDAVGFCEWLSLISRRKIRLPTEQEWEKAARGADGRIYPWGDTWGPRLCNGGNASMPGQLMPVGSFSPAGDSPYGAADMLGNVWEWTSSVFADWTTRQVLRGGCYSCPYHQLRCAYRYSVEPDFRGAAVGFRVVME